MYLRFTLSFRDVEDLLAEGLSRSAFLLVKSAITTPSRARNLNDLAASRSPVREPKMPSTCPT